MIIFYNAAGLIKQAGDRGNFAFQEYTKKLTEGWEIEGMGCNLSGVESWAWCSGGRRRRNQGQGQSQTLLSAPLTSRCSAVLLTTYSRHGETGFSYSHGKDGAIYEPPAGVLGSSKDDGAKSS